MYLNFGLNIFVVVFDDFSKLPTNFQVIWSLFEYTFSFTLCYANITRIIVFWWMTSENPSNLQSFDPKIDKTFHKLVRHYRNPYLHFEYSITFPNTPKFDHLKHSVHNEHFDTDNMA